jgi:hypothetical protein
VLGDDGLEAGGAGGHDVTPSGCAFLLLVPASVLPSPEGQGRLARLTVR